MDRWEIVARQLRFGLGIVFGGLAPFLTTFLKTDYLWERIIMLIAWFLFIGALALLENREIKRLIKQQNNRV